MCGIVGAVAQRNVSQILLEGLSRLEYRGYDSAGICTIDNNTLNCIKTTGKVKNLKRKLLKKKAVWLYWYCTHQMGNSWHSIRGKCSSTHL